ncbi:hypothetical protein IEQ34_017531 [Dendrobium chrysotoxum]|uniref:Protein kinase domain-containing protein n=1 Tax=Dendrobium chrysotoxum TaxID=161865 RepID=A0AAV7GAE8_DENCH|nr:hypothetical protein IEQ34_017531 [Dendrobium chrysotoxum]
MLELLSRLNEKSDVYSYGIVLLELLTGKKAVDEECNLHQLIISKAANDAVMETVEPEISATCGDLGPVKKVFQLALLCTKKQPSDRPTMHEVVRLLNFLAKPTFLHQRSSYFLHLHFHRQYQAT